MSNTVLMMTPSRVSGFTEQTVRQAALVLKEKLEVEGKLPMSFRLGGLVPDSLVTHYLTGCWLEGEGDDIRLWGQYEAIPRLEGPNNAREDLRLNECGTLR